MKKPCKEVEKMKKLAIWDMDGTLTDTMEIWATLSSELLKSLGVEPPADLDQRIGIIGIRQAVKFLREEFALPLSDEALYGKLSDVLCKYYSSGITVKPGVTAILDDLTGNNITCVVLSATIGIGLETALNSTGLAKYFGSNVISCEDLRMHKSNISTFESVMEKYGATADETVVFEDALYAVKTAKAAGCTVCAVKDRFEKRSDEVKAIADHFFESWENFNFKEIIEK